MDLPKKPKPKSTSKLDLADRQIAQLKKRILPEEPHLLQVNIKNPYNGGYPYEFDGTPFENYEVRDLQYMTMVSDGSRGIADARGGWRDEMESRSPSVQAMRSNTATPNPARDPKFPVKKISIADYKNRKAGITTTPKPGATDGGRPGHSRNTSAVSVNTPMSRVPSFEGASETKQNGASAKSVPTETVSSKEPPRPAAAYHPSSASDAKLKSTFTGNGHAEQPPKTSLQPKDVNKDVHPLKTSQPQQPRDQIRHNLPPRPQSPPRKNVDRKPPTSEPRQLKRPLESADSTPAEKRTKTEHTRTPSGSQSTLSRKPETQSEKKPQSSPMKSSSQPSKAMPLSRPADSRDSPKSEKPLKMPPLLSPLPADLENSPLPIPKVRISEPDKKSASNSPKLKISADTIVVKTKSSNSSPLSTAPSSAAPKGSSPFVLPRLLSPTLPDVVEEELLRLHNKKSTVASLHEQARKPNAPGVARKAPKPAKKTVPELSKSQPAAESKESLIVKLKYKKRRANDISRILKLESRPTKEFLRLEKERLARLKAKDDSEDDTPVAPAPSKTIAVAPAARKRPSDTSESRPSEPAAKRVKPSSNTIEVATSRPTTLPASRARSPAPSALSQKSLLATPKKGDALKSVAMRKIDSSDGHARTPQAAATSTPASAEKQRVNGNPDPRSSADAENLKSSMNTLDAQALKLKRRMDEILQTKQQKTHELDEKTKIHGLCVALECMVMYMQSFAAKEKQSKHRNTSAWEDGVKLWGFVDNMTRSYATLNALAVQIGAICKEELARAYMETAPSVPSEASLKALRNNELSKHALWKQSQVTRAKIESLGIKEVQGPWTTVAECAAYTLAALEKYADKDKTGWKAMF